MKGSMKSLAILSALLTQGAPGQRPARPKTRVHSQHLLLPKVSAHCPRPICVSRPGWRLTAKRNRWLKLRARIRRNRRHSP